MPYLLAILALFTPRLAVILLWVFTDWFRGLFEVFLWPVLGFLFLPTTLLWYSVVQHWFAGMWGVVPVVGIIIALALDASPLGSYRRD
jgi:hypothetical protein